MSGLIPSMWWPDKASYDTAVKMCPDIDVDIETCEFLDSVRGLTIEDDFGPFKFTSWLDMWRHWIRGSQRIEDVAVAETAALEAGGDLHVFKDRLATLSRVKRPVDIPNN